MKNILALSTLLTAAPVQAEAPRMHNSDTPMYALQTSVEVIAADPAARPYCTGS